MWGDRGLAGRSAVAAGNTLAAGRTPLYARRDARAAAGPYPMERTLVPARLGDHLDRLYRADCALCGSREDAEDLVQDVRPRSGPAGLLRHDDDLGYLLRALRNTFLTQKLTERRRLRPTRNPNSSTSSPTRERGSPRPRSRPASCVPRSPHGNFLRDVATGAGFLIEVEPSRAIDAFHHPYAYAPRRGKSRRVLRSEKTIVDG
jgi:hypothetical protein